MSEKDTIGGSSVTEYKDLSCPICGCENIDRIIRADNAYPDKINDLVEDEWHCENCGEIDKVIATHTLETPKLRNLISNFISFILNL